MSTALPDQIEIQPIKPFDVRFGPGGASLPGSKSLTNRALLLAALAEGVSRLEGVLLSDDTQRMIEALRSLGFALEVDEPARQVEVRGQGGRIPVDEARLELGNAGTAMRSLTAACCLGRGRYTLDGVARMRQRPIGELVDALRQIGGQVLYLDQIGYPPLQVIGTGQLAGGQLDMAPTLSSQFITALLMAAPYCQQGLTIRFHGPVTSRPYVQMTMALMQRFGATLETEAALTRVRVEPGVYRATDYEIEPDASSASYFLAAAAMTPGSRCVIEGLGRASLQGDAMFAKVLQQMGAQVMLEDHRVVVHGVGQLRGVDVDLNAMPDMAQTLAAAAVLASGPTVIRNVGNLRVKETDRLAALQNELTKLGATVLVHGDDLRIEPPADGRLRPAIIDTYDDHRMAMSFAVIGLRSPGIVIRDPACTGKTFPDFFACLDRLRNGAGPAA